MTAPLYIQTQSFFGHDIWAAHERIGELLAQGVAQITVSAEGDAITVSWPKSRPPVLIPETAA